MSQIFYYGADDEVYGPHNELTVQGWYASGFFSSDVRFQISSSDRFDSNGSLFTLGELIEKNGRTLPFYFSTEKENRENEQEEALQKLKQDVESLLTNKGNNAEKDRIDQLQNEVSSLVESNAALHKKVQELSSKKENSPVSPDLEKKLNELKREVEKQEKSAGSIKKVMSDNTSKCDRNDTKMEQTVKKQIEIEEKMSVHSNQIADLQANGKDIDSNLTAFRETMRVSADQCGEMMNTRKEMKESCDKQTEEWHIIRSELQKIQTQITEVIATMGEHKEGFAAAEKNVELRVDCQSLLGGTATKESAEPPSRKVDISNSLSIPPWELQSKKDQPDAGSEPWNQVKDSKNRTVNAKVVGEMAATDITQMEEKKDQSAEQPPKGGGKESDQEPTKSTKAKPVAKDWAAICRELSDDEEPEEVKSTASYVVVPDTERFVSEFMKLLRAYCAFLESPRETSFTAAAALFKMESIRAFLSACPVGSVFNKYIREALKKELTHLFTAPITCTACNFRMVSPRRMVVHFARVTHGSTRDDNSLFGAEYTEMSETIAQIFMHFITPIKQLDLLHAEEKRLLIQGVNRARALTDADVILPNGDFVTAVMERAIKLKKKDLDDNTTAEQGDAIIKEACITMRIWLEDPENRRTLEADLKRHFAGGIATCGTCSTAYDELEDYYKHATSHGHAEEDRSLFTVLLSLWKGGEYWNGILGL